MIFRLSLTAAVATFAVTSYGFLSANIERLLSVVPDDSFYYLHIARHIATNGQSTFDGLSPTNGYHPLWMALLAGLASAVGDREMLLRAAIGVSLALHACSAYLLFRLVRKLVDAGWGLTAAVCWLINPLAFSIALTATEAALHALAAIILLLTHLRLVEERAESKLPSIALGAGYGAALGVLCLARTDGVVVAALAFVWLAGRMLAQVPDRKRMAFQVLVAGGAFLIVLCPWGVRLIRFRGHLPKGGYDVPHVPTQAWPAPAPAVL